jgi:hypothetical protein
MFSLPSSFLPQLLFLVRRFDGITNQLSCEEWCEVTLGNLPMWLMTKNYLMQYILLEATYLRSASCINPSDSQMGLGTNAAAAAGLEAAASCNPDTGGGFGDLEATNIAGVTTGDEGYSPDRRLQQQQHDHEQQQQQQHMAAAAAATAAAVAAAGAGMVGGPSSPSAAAAAAYAAAAIARDAAAMAAAAAAAAEALGRQGRRAAAAAGGVFAEDPSSSRQQTFTQAGFMPVLPPTTTAPAGAGKAVSGGAPSQLPVSAGIPGGLPEQSGGYRGGSGGLGGYPPGGGSGSRAVGYGPQGTSSSSSSEDAAAYA